MIEIGGAEAKNIKVNYKLFKVSARVSGRNVLVASVNGNGELSWLHDSLPPCFCNEQYIKFQIIKFRNESMHLDIASDALQIFRDDMQCDCTTLANCSSDR